VPDILHSAKRSALGIVLVSGSASSTMFLTPAEMQYDADAKALDPQVTGGLATLMRY
jgi:hypothetical protein